MSGRKRVTYLPGKIGAVSVELCEQAKRTEKISRATIAKAPTMALYGKVDQGIDSSAPLVEESI